MTIQSKLEALFGRGSEAPSLPRQSVEHDSVDEMVFRNYAMDSPRFKRIAIEDAPQIDMSGDEPPAPDFTAATPEEISQWQQAVREARKRREEAAPYSNWENLTRDVFYAYHHPSVPRVLDEQEIDPEVEPHRRIVSKITATNDFAQTRNVTRDDATMAAMTTVEVAARLSELLGDELKEQAEQAEQIREQRGNVEDAKERLEQLREQAREHAENGEAIPDELRDEIKSEVEQKRGAMQAAAALADAIPPMSHDAMAAIEAAVKDGREAAEKGQGVPSFGQGFGKGEPRYESPEQALAIAEAWSTGELQKIAEKYGRFDMDMRFRRAKRVEGGQEEITDLEFGDNLKRALFSELGLLVADETLEDDFFSRYLAGEILQYTTVGEEHAGRGPIGMVLDGSSSMSGERNQWSRAVALAMLNIARREERDFFLVEFSSAGQVEQWVFKAKEDMDAQAVLDMASHFFGGGTQPLLGITKATEIMESVPEFRKADVVIVSDGEASVQDDDRALRDKLADRGVRIHGVGIGGTFRYLAEMCEEVVNVADFELEDPNAATAQLATQIT